MDRTLILAHALPPGARAPRFRRSFSEPQRRELQRLECDAGAIERLGRILPAIAYYCTPGPRLADVRSQLQQIAKETHKAASKLRALLRHPEHDEAGDEARLRLLEAIEERHPERCKPDRARMLDVHERPDLRMPEAQRLLASLEEVTAAAQHAVQRMPGGPGGQTRAISHSYPVELIEAALNVDGEVVAPSESASSPFREIVGICYEAARAKNTDPQRAIREFLKGFNTSHEK